MSLSKLWELVMDREARRAAIHGVAKSRTRPSDWTELNWTIQTMEFSRPGTGVGSWFPSPGDPPNQGSNPGLPHCRWILHQLCSKGSPWLGQTQASQLKVKITQWWLSPPLTPGTQNLDWSSVKLTAHTYTKYYHCSDKYRHTWRHCSLGSRPPQ